jgi:hypothetical protein
MLPPPPPDIWGENKNLKRKEIFTPKVASI